MEDEFGELVAAHQREMEARSRAIWDRASKDAIAFLRARGWGDKASTVEEPGADAAQTAPAIPAPPKNAELVLLFLLPSEHRETVRGSIICVDCEAVDGYEASRRNFGHIDLIGGGL